MMFQDQTRKWTHIQQDKMGHMLASGSRIAFVLPRIGFVKHDNIQSVDLALTFEMLSVPGFYVLVEMIKACCNVRMHGEGLVPTH